MHDACILVLECMMHTPAAAPPIENRIKKRYEHTFNGRSSSRSEQGYYGVGMTGTRTVFSQVISLKMKVKNLNPYSATKP